MPCTYTGSLEGDRAHSAEQTVKLLREELDLRERMLCAVCTRIERVDGIAAAIYTLQMAGRQTEGLSEMEIINWWTDHKKAEGRG